MKRNIHLVLDDSINVDVDQDKTEIVTAKGYRVDGDLLVKTKKDNCMFTTNSYIGLDTYSWAETEHDSSANAKRTPDYKFGTR